VPGENETLPANLVDAYNLGASLGLSNEAVDVIITRRGSVGLAKQDLTRRLNTARAKAKRQADDKEAQRFAAQAIARHTQRQAEYSHERRQARARQPLGARLDATVTALLKVSTVSATSNQPGGHAKPHSKPPPAADHDAHGWRLSLIRWHVEALELELDAYHGLDTPSQLSGEAKDQVIIHRFTGIHSRELAASLPELGSQRTIERARERAGLRPSTGLPRAATQPLPASTGNTTPANATTPPNRLS
jgi:hypothetical protein